MQARGHLGMRVLLVNIIISLTLFAYSNTVLAHDIVADAKSPANSPAQSACGTTTAGLLGFPGLDLSACNQPDDASVPHPAWKPISVGAATCVDWTLYHTNQTGDWEIFRFGEIPNNPKASPNLSHGVGPNVADISPSRSPDGEWVAFTSNRDGNWEIYVAATDGTSQQRVTYNTIAADIAPMWSPEGKSIVFETTRHGSRDLYLVDVATGTEKRLTDNPAQDVNAFWSPDGTRLIFQSDRDGLWQIFELDLASSNVRKLSDGKFNDFNPQYAPDGKRITFRSVRESGKSAIYVMNADLSGLTAISDVKGNASNQVWYTDPNNDLMAYQSDIDGNLEIYIYKFGTGETRRLTNNDVRDVAPTWRCNAPIVIFTSDIMGDANLFQSSALPMNNRPIKPDDINQLTYDPSADQFPANSPSVEDASQRATTGTTG